MPTNSVLFVESTETLCVSGVEPSDLQRLQASIVIPTCISVEARTRSPRRFDAYRSRTSRVAISIRYTTSPGWAQVPMQTWSCGRRGPAVKHNVEMSYTALITMGLSEAYPVVYILSLGLQFLQSLTSSFVAHSTQSFRSLLFRSFGHSLSELSLYSSTRLSIPQYRANCEFKICNMGSFVIPQEQASTNGYRIMDIPPSAFRHLHPLVNEGFTRDQILLCFEVILHYRKFHPISSCSPLGY